MKDSALPNANIYHLHILFIDVCVSGNSVKKRYILFYERTWQRSLLVNHVSLVVICIRIRMIRFGSILSENEDDAFFMFFTDGANALLMYSPVCLLFETSRRLEVLQQSPYNLPSQEILLT